MRVFMKERMLEESVKGYEQYRQKAGLLPMTRAQRAGAAAHRERILEKYRMKDGISRIELWQAVRQYRSLSCSQCEDILFRAANSALISADGAAYSRNFFVPALFEKMVVDAKDVFAVGISASYKVSLKPREVILCAVFTNDPYVPVFPIVFEGAVENPKNLKGRKTLRRVSMLLKRMCPNLAYPVEDMEELRRIIRSEPLVRGSVDKAFMLEKLSEASLRLGIFDTTQMPAELPSRSAAMLDAYGYIQDREIDGILRMEGRAGGRFWERQVNRIAQQAA